MSWKSVSQGFLLLLCVLRVYRCEQSENILNPGQSPFLAHSAHVLENGRIISTPVKHPMPSDQKQWPETQHDDTRRKYIARGDILFPIQPNEPERVRRKIIAETDFSGVSNRWPGGIVPYEFIPGIDSRVRQSALSAMEHWHQMTCLRFEQYDPQRHSNINCKITIEDTGFGCSTFVGYQPASRNYISSYSVYLPLLCAFGSAIHELGHVIGFYHEMARIDRDQEINIYFNTMSAIDAAQYDVMPNPMPGYYGQPYDLGSIMHYYPTNVMSAKDSRRAFLMGQRISLSFLDSKLANLGYHCADHCQPRIDCKNEGYVTQFCRCACPDGFSGDQCQLLQGQPVEPTPIPTEILPTASARKTTTTITTIETSSTTTTTSTSVPEVTRWLEWSSWSNCSVSCGAGIHVRTRLCSNTTIDGSADPCSSLGGSSFEIESCQSAECPQADIVLSCTFDLVDENCPVPNKDHQQVQKGVQADEFRPISDHTRGDGNYFIFHGETSESNGTQTWHVGQFSRSNHSSEENHCLEFWYAKVGAGVASLTVFRDSELSDDRIQFDSSIQGRYWRQLQHTISNPDHYQLEFAYQSSHSGDDYFAIDDISITTGACGRVKLAKAAEKRTKRKRRQIAQSCSRVVDLTTSNNFVTITSPNYPNLYPANSNCYYYLRAPANNRLILQFTDFNFPTSSFDNCDDSMEIRYYHLGQPGPTYCGTGANTNNLRFVSSKNYILLVFRSNSYYSGRGFSAQAALAQ